MSGNILVTSTVNCMSALTSAGAFLTIAIVNSLNSSGKQFCKRCDDRRDCIHKMLYNRRQSLDESSNNLNNCLNQFRCLLYNKFHDAVNSIRDCINKIFKDFRERFCNLPCYPYYAVYNLRRYSKDASIKSGTVSTTVSARCTSKSPAPFVASAINLPMPLTISGDAFTIPSTICSMRETPFLMNSGMFLTAASPMLPATVPITLTASGRILAHL